MVMAETAEAVPVKDLAVVGHFGLQRSSSRVFRRHPPGSGFPGARAVHIAAMGYPDL